MGWKRGAWRLPGRGRLPAVLECGLLPLSGSAKHGQRSLKVWVEHKAWAIHVHSIAHGAEKPNGPVPSFIGFETAN